MRTLILFCIFTALSAVEAPLRIVCFGDSITGYRPEQPYLHRYIKWSDLLGLMIEARLGPDSVLVHNAGYAGDTTGPHGQRPGAVVRLEREVLARNPAIAVILIGGNDAGLRVPREQTAANLDAIFARCRAAGIKVLALQYGAVFDPEAPGTAWVHLLSNNDLIAVAAAAHSYPTLDLLPIFRAAGEAAGSHMSLVNGEDRVHLAPGGEMLMARAVFAKLLELGWLGP